ncbi:MAG: hypothetical protein AAF329_00410 [Cyanobacteria bacterium P01_A01_bin.17]
MSNRRNTYDRTSLLKQHPRWLDRLGHRCQFTGNIVGKKYRGRYRGYDFHHTHSGAYGRERPGWNYLLLSDWSHWFVHFLGGVIIQGRGTRCVTIQNARAKRLPCSWVWKFPNPLQQGFNFWCRLPWGLKWVVQVAIITLVMVTAGQWVIGTKLNL